MKPAITPGEVLLEDYLIPMGISQNALARALGISPQSINEIVLGRRSITPEMSLKLGKFFKQSAQFWFNIQTTCDFRQLLEKEKRRSALHPIYHPKFAQNSLSNM
jgi:addiction module HigA family antidote